MGSTGPPPPIWRETITGWRTPPSVAVGWQRPAVRRPVVRLHLDPCCERILPASVVEGPLGPDEAGLGGDATLCHCARALAAYAARC